MRADAKGLGSVINRQILKYAIANHSRELQAARARITPCEDGLDENPSGPNALHSYMGDIGEQLWLAIWGGEWIKKIIPAGNAARLPDVINRSGNIFSEDIFSEVKYCCVSAQFQIRDTQMELYNYLQASFPEWQGRMTVFRHGIDAIKTYPGSKRMLCKELAERTLYGIDVSLDLMQRIHADELGELTRFYAENEQDPDAKTYETCTCVKSKTQHRFIDETEDILRKMNVDPQDFRIERLWSPANIRLLGYGVDRFPIVRITRRDYRDWAQSYACDYWTRHDAAEPLAPEEFMRLLAPRGRNSGPKHKEEELPDWVTSEVA